MNINDEKKIDRMYLEMFGDKEAGRVGMVEKMDTLYELFTSTKNSFSFIGWMVGAIIVFGVFWGTIKGGLIALANSIITTK